MCIFMYGSTFGVFYSLRERHVSSPHEGRAALRQKVAVWSLTCCYYRRNNRPRHSGY